MKKITLSILITMLLHLSLMGQNVGINDDSSSPDASAMLHIQSTSKGLLIPRMSGTQRTNLSSPAVGLLVFDTDTESFWYNETSGWVELVAANAPTLADGDLDTQVQLEESADEDIIRFDLAGSERWVMESSRLWPNNTGFSLFIGEGAGANDDLTNNHNHFIGYFTGNSNTTGGNNVGIGRQILQSNTSGFANIGMGMAALNANSTGNYNLGIGYRALFSNDGGDNNIGFGKAALRNNVSGYYNISIGDSSLYNNLAGYYNLAVGNDALYSNTGSFNLALGNGALRNNTNANSNLAIGTNALHSIQTATGNLAIGHATLYASTSTEPNIAVGDSALHANTTGNWNVAFGKDALYSNTIGSRNIGLGHDVLNSNIDGTDNLGIGYLSLNSNIDGDYNIAIGSNTLETNNDGNYNIAIGYNALNDNLTGDFSIAIGNNSLQQSTGNNNTAIGRSSQAGGLTGIENTSMGALSMYQITTGSSNTAIGYGAGVNVFGSSNSTYLGKFADQSSGATQTNSMALGFNAKTTASNQIRIGNTSISDIGGYSFWNDLSDGRFKKNIEENVPGLDFILKLRPVTYQLDVSALNQLLGVDGAVERVERQTGFIAQEVEELVHTSQFDFSGVVAPRNTHDHYGIRYSQFVMPLVKAIQEQQLIIEELRKKIVKLESTNVHLAGLDSSPQQK